MMHHGSGHVRLINQLRNILFFVLPNYQATRGQQSITAMRERNFLTPEMYGAASIGERQQDELQYTRIAGFMRLNFPSEWLITTVYGDPSNHTSDQVVFLSTLSQKLTV